tara:strand:+ start:341 stop:571 length:231 start_codon:yes stop_codon:yes gene_type:complete
MDNVNWNKHKRPQTKKPGWLRWQPANPMKYLLIIAFCLFGLPKILGLYLTPLGAIINILFIDWVIYKKETSFINPT